MQITIRHRLGVTVGDGVARAALHLLLTPQSSSVQTVGDWRLEAPGMDGASGFIDAYGNRAHLATQTRPGPQLVITASGVVTTHDRAGVVGRLARDPVPALFTRVTPLTRPTGAITQKFRTPPRTGEERIALLHGLMARVAEVLGTSQSQSQSQAQAQSQSQAQAGGAPEAAAAHAHAFVGAARALGIPARYVTGYLVPEAGRGAIFHAWAEAWDDKLGWIGFDALLGLCPGERHVRVACGLDAATAAPVRAVPLHDPPTSLEIEVVAQ